MELVIHILMVFIIINCILKLSFLKLWQTLLFSFLCAVFILWSCRFAVIQSKTQLTDFFNNITIMQNSAVLVTLESGICFAFCFAALRELFGRKKKRWILPLYWYPGLLVFPVLFYLLTQLIFALPGADFTKTSYWLAGSVFVGLTMLSYLVKKMYPEREFRLEIHFLTSLFVCIIGLITTVNGNITYHTVKEQTNFKALAIAGLLFGITFIIGLVWDNIKWRIKQKKDLSNKQKTQL